MSLSATGLWYCKMRKRSRFARINFNAWELILTRLYITDAVMPEPVYVELTDDQGQISSPEYPMNYPPFNNYTWKVEVSEGKVLQRWWINHSVRPTFSMSHLDLEDTDVLYYLEQIAFHIDHCVCVWMCVLCNTSYKRYIILFTSRPMSTGSCYTANHDPARHCHP